MRILIDIGHPAHVHYYKNFIKLMEVRGHEFLVTARNREVIQDLLLAENIKFYNRGKGATTIFGKILYTLKADLILLYYSLKFKPDLFLSHGSHYAMHVSNLLNKKCISTSDSDHIKMNAKYLMPYLDALLTPDVYKLNYGSIHYKFKAYMELLYLHPNYYKLPQFSEKKYFLLRFVSWNAFHDVGQGGLSPQVKKDLVNLLLQYGDVHISCEGELPKHFLKYKANFKPELMHDVMAGAHLIVSEGATTASEAAVLGTPVIYVNSLAVSYCEDQEDSFGLCHNFRDENGVLDKVKDLLIDNNVKEIYREKRNMMLAEKIDPTQFLIDFVENFAVNNIQRKKKLE